MSFASPGRSAASHLFFLSAGANLFFFFALSFVRAPVASCSGVPLVSTTLGGCTDHGGAAARHRGSAQSSFHGRTLSHTQRGPYVRHQKEAVTGCIVR